MDPLDCVYLCFHMQADLSVKYTSLIMFTSVIIEVAKLSRYTTRVIVTLSVDTHLKLTAKILYTCSIM